MSFTVIYGFNSVVVLMKENDREEEGKKEALYIMKTLKSCLSITDYFSFPFPLLHACDEY